MKAVQLLAPWRDRTLLEQALRHRSAGTPNNERLEFIGDAVLSLIVGQELFERFPDAAEGCLTRLRARLVRGETLAALSGMLGLNEMLILGDGEERSGGRSKDSILAGAFEAVLGAIYCLDGLAAAREFVVKAYGNNFDGVIMDENSRDAKTQLQERLQAHGEPLPEYQTLRVTSGRARPWFRALCRADGCSAEGEGSSMRKAEQAAAQKVLEQLIASQ